MRNDNPKMRRFVSAIALPACLIAFILQVAAQSRHVVTLDDLQSLKEISTLDVSPDGKLLTFTTWDGDMWFTRTSQGAVPQNLGKGVLPRWSPDSKKLAYYSSDSGAMQLYVRDPESGRAEQVTRVEGGINPDPRTWGMGAHGWIYDSLRYSWSPDSRQIVFASRVKSTSSTIESTDNSETGPPPSAAEGEPLVLTGSTPPEWTLSGIFRVGGFEPRQWVNGKYSVNLVPGEKPQRPPKLVNQLFIVDIFRKETRQLTWDDQVYFAPDWSPDGHTIVCSSFQGGQSAGAGPIIIYVIDELTGRRKTLIADGKTNRLPRWSPDGRSIGYLTSEKYHYQSAALVHVSGGTPSRIAPGFNYDIEDFSWAGDGESVVLLYRDAVSLSLGRTDISGADVVNLFPGIEAGRLLLRTSNQGDIGWVESDGKKFSVIRFLPAHTDATAAYNLTDLNTQIKGWALGDQEVVHWKGAGDVQMQGVLIKPVGYQSGQRYPLIVDGYPWLGNGFFPDPMIPLRAFAGDGYMVFQPDPRTPNSWMIPFRNEEFDHQGRGPHGADVMTEDVLSGVQELIRRGLVDPSRMALYGFSNGGGVVNQLVTKTDRFRCAVSVASALGPDWARPFFLHTLDPSLPYFIGATPWEDSNAYVQLSAVYHLDKVNTPLLLAVGDDDGDFLLNQIEMYNGLRWLGKKVTLLRYPGQGHGFTGAAMKDFWRREGSFLSECLKQ